MTKSSKLLKFILPSLFGLLFFVIPLPYGKIIPLEGMASVNIGVGALIDLFKIVLSDYLMMLSFIVIGSSAVLSIAAKFYRIPNQFLRSIFDVSPVWLICRVLGGIFTTMVFFGLGSEIIISPDTGGAMITLIPSLLGIFFVTGYLLPLVIDFGLMDFCGTIISKYMYRLFNVPGRSSIDAISSWLGDGTLGVTITDAQYRAGFYTAKEAAIISTCFSLVSLPFSTVIAEQLDMMHMFVKFYGTVTIASFTCALILPRIYPLSKIPNNTYNNIKHKKETTHIEGNIYKHAVEGAVKRAESAPSVRQIAKNGLKFTIDLYFALLPLCMAWGTIALIITNYTSIFTYIAAPIEWLFNLVNIPNAVEAAPAVLVGFADMFIPSIMVSGANIAPITKFIIGTLSISQLIYLTETGAVILKSSIPLNIKDLFIIYLIRTVISLTIIIAVAKMIF
ncbi:MAG: YjiH family protein [Bacteroidales bacterium]